MPTTALRFFNELRQSGGTLIDQMDRSIVPQELRPILDMVSPDSFVATLDIAPDGGYGLRVTPVTVDADGVPMTAEGEAFDRIAERLVRLSGEVGTVVRIGDGELTVGLAAERV